MTTIEGTKGVETLIRQLDAQKDAYLEAFQKIHDRLTQDLAAGSSRPRANSRLSSSVPSSERNSDSKASTTAAATSVHLSSTSKSTGDDSDEEDEALYAQGALDTESYAEEGLRAHLRTHKFREYEKQILYGVVDDSVRLSQSPLLPNHPRPCDDRSHLTHSQVFDIGSDGAPLPMNQQSIEVNSGRAMSLWHAIKDVNPTSKERRAVGRITIVREPSPILFGAVHHALHQAFDLEELFRHLVEADLSSASMFRAFDESELKQRSFVFNFEYFTLIGKGCQPMRWQLSAGQEDRKPGFIQISRCSSVVALTLGGPPIKEIKNPSRLKRSTKDKGSVSGLSFREYM